MVHRKMVIDGEGINNCTIEEDPELPQFLHVYWQGPKMLGSAMVYETRGRARFMDRSGRALFDRITMSPMDYEMLLLTNNKHPGAGNAKDLKRMN